jgi:hypothetical protein
VDAQRLTRPKRGRGTKPNARLRTRADAARARHLGTALDGAAAFNCVLCGLPIDPNTTQVMQSVLRWERGHEVLFVERQSAFAHSSCVKEPELRRASPPRIASEDKSTSPVGQLDPTQHHRQAGQGPEVPRS